jgi:hypothetical protein
MIPGRKSAAEGLLWVDSIDQARQGFNCGYIVAMNDPRARPDLRRDPLASRTVVGPAPKLVNAAWDWGGSDWETALGAAAHMGRKDIAFCLLESRARMAIFAAAMLGHVQIVRATLDAIPDAQNWQGPHGIPLLKHAEAGGTESDSCDGIPASA